MCFLRIFLIPAVPNLNLNPLLFDLQFDRCAETEGKMNQRQRRICVGAVFLVFVAIFHELIHVEDTHEKFSVFSVVAESVFFLIFALIGYVASRNSK
jgi:hypothetical protein